MGLKRGGTLWMDDQNTIVLDLTYLCNSTCRYCRWGSPNTEGRKNLTLNSLIIPKSTLDALNTKRLVLSGGEPRLYPNIGEVLSYYRKYVENIILITNGYGVISSQIESLIDMGINGFTFSIDSVIPEEEYASRRTDPEMFRNILASLREISSLHREFELGINTVVTHANAKWGSIRKLLEFSEELDLDFIKFSPIFDDGYAGLNAPDLLLTENDVDNLRIIGEKITRYGFKNTNSPQFWFDIAEMTIGKQPQGVRCGLGPHKANSINGMLTMCYWVKEVTYGQTNSALGYEHATSIQRQLELSKENCPVNFHCFCNQKISHTWW